jgi:hypothetical protein
MTMQLDELLQLQALRVKAGYDNAKLIDRVIESGEAGIEVRNLCAKVHPELYDEVTSVCALLDLSKRQFVEAAVVEAIARAHAILEKTGALTQRGL